MFPTSTQKRFWIFGNKNELMEMRNAVNKAHIDRFKAILAEYPHVASQEDFLTADEEAVFCRIVTETGIRFGDEFRPEMWPSVRWTAFAYFKRFYLRHSVMEYSPKNVMVACYYLAAKVDEFNVTIDNFVDNLSSGTRESNIEIVLTLEPEIMLKLDYYLAVHSPFRPFEGHMIEMKTRMGMHLSSLKFDIETIRPFSTEFFRMCLYGDVMLLYPPSQIALAAIKYGLDKTLGESRSSNFLRDSLAKLMDADFGATGEKSAAEIFKLEKIQIRIDQICELVCEQAVQNFSAEDSERLQKKFFTYIQKVSGELLPRLKQLEKEQQQNPGSGDVFDSDDDF
ncbi:hypothetical protein ACQ4LE_008154 [Meloidogyne hapla]